MSSTKFGSLLLLWCADHVKHNEWNSTCLSISGGNTHAGWELKTYTIACFLWVLTKLFHWRVSLQCALLFWQNRKGFSAKFDTLRKKPIYAHWPRSAVQLEHLFARLSVIFSTFRKISFPSMFLLKKNIKDEARQNGKNSADPSFFFGMVY